MLPKGNLMASIIDSIRSVYMDNYSLIRLGVLSYAIYMIYTLIVPSPGLNIMNVLLWLLITYIYLGFGTIIISNRINQRIETLPKFNPVYFLTIATKSFMISIPFAVIGLFVVGFVVGLFNFEGLPQQIALWLIRFFIFSMLVTSLINFAEKYEIKDGFNIPKLMTGMADVLVYTLVCVLLILIISVFIALPSLYLIYTFFKFGPLFKFVSVFFVTMNIAILSDYWGQLHFDIESKNNYY